MLRRGGASGKTSLWPAADERFMESSFARREVPPSSGRELEPSGRAFSDLWQTAYCRMAYERRKGTLPSLRKAPGGRPVA